MRLPPPRIVQARVSLPSDRSFASYEQARAHLDGPRLADDLDLYWNQQLLDVLLEYPIRSDRSDFAIHPRVDRFGRNVSTALRFLPPDGATRAFEFHGDPGPGAARSALAPGRVPLRRVRASGTSSKAPTTCCSCSAW